MRENDDVTPGGGSGSLAEGLGETIGPGGGAPADDSFGEGRFDDTYDDAGGSFGDGDLPGTEPEQTLDPSDAEVAGGFDDTGLDDTGLDPASLATAELPSQAASPIEGVGYLIEQVREALFGDDDVADQVDPLDGEQGFDLGA